MSNHGYGRIQYSVITIPNEELSWCYSYQELQKELDSLCKNHKLEKVYVRLENYLACEHYDGNYCNFDIRSDTLIVLDNAAIELCIHGEGMIQYRIIDFQDIKIKNTKDYPPSNLVLARETYYYDLSTDFELSYEGLEIVSVLVDKTAYYVFSLDGYDEEKADVAAHEKRLPNGVHFYLENGVDFGICADDIEYFYIKLKRWKK